MKKISTRIGSIITWYDFIKSKKNMNTGNIVYEQSNTKLEGYSQRYIGLYLTDSGNILIAVAVNKKEDNSNWWRYILENRISNMISNKLNISPDDKGCTMVPMPYKDFLFRDPAAYGSLYGMIEPTVLDMALKEAKASNQNKIDAAVSQYRAANSANT